MSGTTQNSSDVEMGNKAGNDDVECVCGHYYSLETGSFLSLSERKPMNEAERVLEGVEGVVSVVQVARYFHVYVDTSVVDESDVRSKMLQYGTARFDRESETRTPRKPYNKELVFTTK